MPLAALAPLEALAGVEGLVEGWAEVEVAVVAVAVVEAPGPPPLALPLASAASCWRKMMACWPICQRLETTKYRTTPAGTCRAMNPKNRGKILPIICIWGFWADAGVRAVIWRCW